MSNRGTFERMYPRIKLAGLGVGAEAEEYISGVSPCRRTAGGGTGLPAFCRGASFRLHSLSRVISGPPSGRGSLCPPTPIFQGSFSAEKPSPCTDARTTCCTGFGHGETNPAAILGHGLPLTNVPRTVPIFAQGVLRPPPAFAHPLLLPLSTPERLVADSIPLPDPFADAFGSLRADRGRLAFEVTWFFLSRSLEVERVQQVLA